VNHPRHLANLAGSTHVLVIDALHKIFNFWSRAGVTRCNVTLFSTFSISAPQFLAHFHNPQTRHHPVASVKLSRHPDPRALLHADTSLQPKFSG